MVSCLQVPDETIDTLKDAVELFREKTGMKVVQPKFLEYLFADNPKELWK